MNDDQLNDFRFCFDTPQDDLWARIRAQNQNQVLSEPIMWDGPGQPEEKYLALRLCSGDVNPERIWPSEQDPFTHFIVDGDRQGYFLGTCGSIGVRFGIPNDASGFRYGYIRIAVEEDGRRVVIQDWAYESDAEVPITTPPCDCEVPGPEAVPTLNQWGILIFAGLVLMEGARRLKGRNRRGA
jgi:hypothetical protein